MLLIYCSIWSLVMCKYRDSNMFGNHFRILNARMVQSVESVWTVRLSDYDSLNGCCGIASLLKMKDIFDYIFFFYIYFLVLNIFNNEIVFKSNIWEGIYRRFIRGKIRYKLISSFCNHKFRNEILFPQLDTKFLSSFQNMDTWADLRKPLHYSIKVMYTIT